MNIKIALAALGMVIAPPGIAAACDPAPSCWMEESKEYLYDVCKATAKDHITAKMMKKELDESPSYVEDQITGELK